MAGLDGILRQEAYVLRCLPHTIFGNVLRVSRGIAKCKADPLLAQIAFC